MPSDNIVSLKIDGRIKSGWTDVSITRAVNALCASFDLGINDLETAAVFSQCEVLIDDELLVTGFVDRISQSYDAKSLATSISGRDKTQDLIDCSAINSPNYWRNRNLGDIANELCSPFGIKVVVEAAVGANFASFSLEQGESPFEAITRMARMRGLLVKSSIKGDLVIYSPEPVMANWQLIEGENIVSLDYEQSGDNRFSQYIIKGQHSYSGNVSPKDASAPKGEGRDVGVARYRPMMIIADEQSTNQSLKSRAAWEATTRLAQSKNINIAVHGWRAPDGALYAPGPMVRVRSPLVGIDADYMISEVTLSLDATSRSASLKLVPPESYTPEPIVPEPPPKPKRRRAK